MTGPSYYAMANLKFCRADNYRFVSILHYKLPSHQVCTNHGPKTACSVFCMDVKSIQLAIFCLDTMTKYRNHIKRAVEIQISVKSCELNLLCNVLILCGEKSTKYKQMQSTRSLYPGPCTRSYS